MLEISFLSLGFIFGAVLGSFANVLAIRSLQETSFGGRSHCPNCKTTLAWYDLFPIISYLMLGGKCRHCQKKISSQYLWVEIIVGLLGAAIFYFGLDLKNLNISQLAFGLFVITIFATVFITDIKDFLIPDRVILPAIVIALVWQIIVSVIKISYEPLGGSILSGLAIGGFFLLLIIITKGRGMGGGDVKLGAFIGLVLGFPNSLVAIMLSFLTGAVFSIILIIFGKKHFGQVIPFGPFLVIGSLIAMFWGNKIMNWYLNIQI